MRKMLTLAALLLCATSAIPQQATFLELGLYWGNFSGPQVTNATTTLYDSHGNALATVKGAWPHVTLPLAIDTYKIIVSADPANGHPRLGNMVVIPLATKVPMTTYVIQTLTVKMAFNADGLTGTFDVRTGGTF